MNTFQEDHLSMYYSVEDVCQKHRAIWVANAVFSATHDEWAEIIPKIEQNRDLQTLETTGITTDKTSKRAIMTEKALFIQNRLQSYANVTGNSELLESVQYSESKLKKARDTNIVGICNTILGRAKEFAPSILTYGVDETAITDYETSIGAYVLTLASPKVVKSQTKTATENLTKLFKDAENKLTKRMDLDIELFKTSSPEFYSQFKTARIVVSTGNRSTSVLGNVTLAGNGTPIKGVTFSFAPGSNGTMKMTSTESSKPIVKKSATKGNFRIANLPEGTYTVTVKKIGFKDQIITLNVASGETTSIKVELEKS